MTSTVSAALAFEHRLVDDGIECFAGSDTAAASEQQRAGLLQAITVLRRHIYLEEEFLFPPLRDAGLMGPVMVMVHEHGQIWPALDLLEQQLRAGSNDRARSVCQALLSQLAAHNMKEERILYAQVEDLLAETELAALTELLTTVHAPAGWACQGLPTS